MNKLIISFGVEKNYRKIFLQITKILIIWRIVMMSNFPLNWYWFINNGIQIFHLNILVHITIIICLTNLIFIIFIREKL